MDNKLAKKLKDAGWPQGHDCIDGKKIGDMVGACLCIPVKPTLSELIDAIMKIIIKHNNWENQEYEDLWFFELAPNLHTQGDIDDIGKLSEWRATLSIGIDLDFIDMVYNYFGETPEEAVALLFIALKTDKNL